MSHSAQRRQGHRELFGSVPTARTSGAPRTECRTPVGVLVSVPGGETSGCKPAITQRCSVSYSLTMSGSFPASRTSQNAQGLGSPSNEVAVTLSP